VTGSHATDATSPVTGNVNVAVVGATGVVGQEMLRILAERGFPVGDLRLFASTRSEGRVLEWEGRELTVEVLREGCFEGTDLVLMEVESPLSREWAPVAVKEGAIVIDNSSAWRMSADVPLVVSEVNPHALDSHQGIVANPNCTTMVLMPVLKPLDVAAGLDRVVVSSYQAVSGSGKAGIDALAFEVDKYGNDLHALRRSGLTGVEPAQDVYPAPIAFNVIPACDSFVDDGTFETKEERKLVDESRKILEHADLAVAATCVRVPVVAAHSMTVNAEFRDEMTAKRARDLLGASPGVVVDGADGTGFVTPLQVAGADGSHVSRLRDDDTRPNTLDLFVIGDNLRKGAALNCVQIAEDLIERGHLS